MVGRTLGVLSAELAAAMSEQVQDKPDVGNQDSFDSARLTRKPDDYYEDWTGRFYAGQHKDHSFDVVGFEGDNGKITFLPKLADGEKVGADDLYYLSMEFEPEELIRALNSAITIVENEALEDLVDETLLVVADQWEYTLPSKFTHLETIVQESGTPDQYSEENGKIPNTDYQMLRKNPTILWFDKGLVSLTEGRKLRLIGQKAPSQLVSDTDTTEINFLYLIQQAKALLHQSKIQGADPDRHEVQMKLAQALADRYRGSVYVTPRGWPV